MSTIAAVSTPRMAGGISVIRISGEKSLEISDKLFKPVSRKETPSGMKGYTAAYGKIYSPLGEELDDCVITVFRAPRSYTGEDVAEISCHGGIFVTERILRAVYELGAVPAGNGEFTKRAFLNGKLTLTQAEAVMDIISAEGRAFHRRAISVKEGALYKKIKASSDKLLKVLGDLDVWVDYPDEDIPEVSPEMLAAELEDIFLFLKKTASGYDSTRILKAGIDTVIAGKPNVGKSTLMNLLAGCDRSIVTEIAGTTRDIIEESVRLGDIVLRLSDTAGLRETGDIIEEAGIEKAKKRLSAADLIIAVFDNGCPLDEDDMRLIDLCKNAGAQVIACINKCDKLSALDERIISGNFENVVQISAGKGEGSDELEKILSKLFLGESAADDITINERQKQCLDKAADDINKALAAVKTGVTLDAVNILLDSAYNALCELTGERVTERVIDEVFSRFCVGK